MQQMMLAMIRRIGEEGEAGALSPSRNDFTALQSLTRGMIPSSLPIRPPQNTLHHQSQPISYILEKFYKKKFNNSCQKRISFHLQAYNIYARKKIGGKMLTEADLQKKWESLTFTDDFIFSRVMHDENICRQVVELILGVRIGKIFSWGS